VIRCVKETREFDNYMTSGGGLQRACVSKTRASPFCRPAGAAIPAPAQRYVSHEAAPTEAILPFV
jgi:hypothetical protein